MPASAIKPISRDNPAKTTELKKTAIAKIKEESGSKMSQLTDMKPAAENTRESSYDKGGNQHVKSPEVTKDVTVVKEESKAAEITHDDRRDKDERSRRGSRDRDDRKTPTAGIVIVIETEEIAETGIEATIDDEGQVETVDDRRVRSRSRDRRRSYRSRSRDRLGDRDRDTRRGDNSVTRVNNSNPEAEAFKLAAAQARAEEARKWNEERKNQPQLPSLSARKKKLLLLRLDQRMILESAVLSTRKREISRDRENHRREISADK
ncbi:hypothetical protein DID88_001404 [Monilinia fructigena]|uniref:Uncharacterized protein n=1 Tax=Monilinia fructigena TaxID=38457 RepID=A0A395IWY0_9HELO|nr:hypothetical protein DID88_001404 [Monilinia fructigena]